MTDSVNSIKTIDNQQAPEFFASFLAGAAFDNPNVRLTFASARADHSTSPGPVNNVVNLRVVMSVAQATAMVDFLQIFLSAAQLNATQQPQGQPLQ